MSEKGREIKVRAWNPNVKKMGKPFTLSDAFYEGFAPPVVDPLSGELERDVIFLQYTGLEDKNGVEIYEGDCVYGHYFYFDGNFDADGEIEGLVKYFDTSCGFLIQESSGSVMRFDETSHFEEPCLEVIGNIYENPELLEGK